MKLWELCKLWNCVNYETTQTNETMKLWKLWNYETMGTMLTMETTKLLRLIKLWNYGDWNYGSYEKHGECQQRKKKIKGYRKCMMSPCRNHQHFDDFAMRRKAKAPSDTHRGCSQSALPSGATFPARIGRRERRPAWAPSSSPSPESSKWGRRGWEWSCVQTWERKRDGGRMRIDNYNQ